MFLPLSVFSAILNFVGPNGTITEGNEIVRASSLSVWPSPEHHVRTDLAILGLASDQRGAPECIVSYKTLMSKGINPSQFANDLVSNPNLILTCYSPDGITAHASEIDVSYIGLSSGTICNSNALSYHSVGHNESTIVRNLGFSSNQQVITVRHQRSVSKGTLLAKPRNTPSNRAIASMSTKKNKPAKSAQNESVSFKTSSKKTCSCSN